MNNQKITLEYCIRIILDANLSQISSSTEVNDVFLYHNDILKAKIGNNNAEYCFAMNSKLKDDNFKIQTTRDGVSFQKFINNLIYHFKIF